jgi:hypothetical protein
MRNTRQRTLLTELVSKQQHAFTAEQLWTAARESGPVGLATVYRTLALLESDGRVRKFKADGKKEKHQFDNGTVETKSKWSAEGLVIETDMQGMKLTQTYSLAPGREKRQLMLQTKMEGGNSPDGDERKPVIHYYDDAVDVQ